MKKLIMAVAIVCAAVVSQGAACAWNWTSTGTNAAKTFYGPEGSTIAGAMVYLFDAGVVSQGDLVTAVRGGSDISTLSSIGNATLDANSRLAATTIADYGTDGKTYAFYMAIVQGDYVFVSDPKTGLVASEMSPPSVSFSGIKTQTSNNLGSADYSSAGWYQTVPEPTSGLLMLLGMAGLALRRRRA